MPAGLARSATPRVDDGASTATAKCCTRRGTAKAAARSHGSRPTAATPRVVDATIAAEDHRFFEHHGIDPIAAVAPRLSRHARHGDAPKAARRSRSRSRSCCWRVPVRRGRAAGAERSAKPCVALRLEHRFTKREMLALYLNLAPYGNQLIGADRASRAYFGRAASLLTPAQAGVSRVASAARPRRTIPIAIRERARIAAGAVIVQMGARCARPGCGAGRRSTEQLTLIREAAAFLAPHFVNRVLATSWTATRAADRDHARRRPAADGEGIIRRRAANSLRHGAHNVAAVVLDNGPANGSLGGFGRLQRSKRTAARSTAL